jgi:hypothetical protein
MTFSELVSALKNIPTEERRAAQETYFEAVFRSSEMTTVNTTLEAYFGVPLKPSGVRASPEALKISEPYGGIQTGQTLYSYKTLEGTDCALLWPWGSGIAVTVKVVTRKAS